MPSLKTPRDGVIARDGGTFKTILNRSCALANNADGCHDEFWLKSVRKCDHNTAIKYLSNFKKIVNICIKNGWLDRNPFAGFKMTKREVERPFLVEEELNRIIEKTFLMPRMNQVRDIFIFCCYTGLAYVDVEKLNREEITTGIEVKNGSGPVGRKLILRRESLCFLLHWRFWIGIRMIRSV